MDAIAFISFGLVGLGFLAYQPLLVIQSQILFIHISNIYDL